MRHLGDIKKLNGAVIEPVDCITGGSPCQDLSVAGKRAGLKHTDRGNFETTRSGLFMEQVRIVREMRENDRRTGRSGEMVRPRFLVWENVPGAFSSNFRDGYGDFGSVLEEIVRIAEPAFSLPGLQGKQKWTKAGAIDGDGWSVAWRTHDAQYWGVPQRRRRISVVADFGGQRAGEILFERKGVSGHTDESQQAWEEATGHPTESAGVYDRGAEGEGNCKKLRGIYNDKFQPIAFAQNQRDEVRDLKDKAGALAAEPGMKQQNFVAHPMTMQAIGEYKDCDEASSCKMQDYKDATDLVCEPVFERTIRWIVRRLTPMECERLQGYPDGWTDIGEWTDSKGKKHQTSDTSRYKALGNSIALPFWYWMMQNMAEYLPEKPTLGSLFDGIGGFPLCWERIHGKGTARWASEIEEFPMAVTKKRFGEG